MKHSAEWHDYQDGLQYCNPPLSADAVYKEVADRLAKEVAQGKDPYVIMWKNAKDAKGPIGTGVLPINFISRKRYTGGNVLQLLGNSESGFTNMWLTAKQCKKAGGTIQAGAQPVPIVFVKVEDEVDAADPTVKPERRAVVRAYFVYNTAQCEGLRQPGEVEEPKESTKVEELEDGRIPKLDKIIEETGAHIIHKGNKAFYSPTFDEIVLPKFNQFVKPQYYYQVAFHELGHWTGAPHRLKRKYGARFGNPEYSFEELVAETCAALCMFSHNLPMIEQSGAYLRNYLAKINVKDRDAELWRAFSLADQAYRVIMPEFVGGKKARQAQAERTKVVTRRVEFQDGSGNIVKFDVKAPANATHALVYCTASAVPWFQNRTGWHVARTFEDNIAAVRYKLHGPLKSGAKAEGHSKKTPAFIAEVVVTKLLPK